MLYELTADSIQHTKYELTQSVDATVSSDSDSSTHSDRAGYKNSLTLFSGYPNPRGIDKSIMMDFMTTRTFKRGPTIFFAQKKKRQSILKKK